MLPKSLLHKIKQNTQLLAAMWFLGRSTGVCYASVETIGRVAILPERTVQRGVQRLLAHRPKLILRRRTPASVKTNAYQFTDSTTAAFAESGYGYLPRWGCSFLGRWSDRVVLAFIIARHQLLENLEKAGHGNIDHLRYECGRAEYSLRQLRQHTGLSKQAVIAAKRRLKEMGLIMVDGREDAWRGILTDDIVPDPEFRLPASCLPPKLEFGPSKTRAKIGQPKGGQ